MEDSTFIDCKLIKYLYMEKKKKKANRRTNDNGIYLYLHSKRTCTMKELKKLRSSKVWKIKDEMACIAEI